MMELTKGQSAIEYLTTYGWAILILAIVLAAIVELGLFNPAQFTNQECVLPADFSCPYYSLDSNGNMLLGVIQNLQYPINVTRVGCSTNSTPKTYNAIDNPATSNQVYMPIGSSYNFTLTCYQGSGTNIGSPVVQNPGTVFQGSVIINYTDDLTGFPHSDTGKVVLKVT